MDKNFYRQAAKEKEKSDVEIFDFSLLLVSFEAWHFTPYHSLR